VVFASWKAIFSKTDRTQTFVFTFSVAGFMPFCMALITY
jgi:hypothetical protein